MIKMRGPQNRSSQGRGKFQEETGAYGIEYLILLLFIVMGFAGIGELLEQTSLERGRQATGKGDPSVISNYDQYSDIKTGLPCRGGAYQDVAFEGDACK